MSDVRLVESPEGLNLSNEHVRAEVRLAAGTFDLIDVPSGRKFLSSAATSVAPTDGPASGSREHGFVLEGSREVADAQGAGVALSLSCEGVSGYRLRFTITLYDGQPFAVLQSEIATKDNARLRVQAFHVLDAVQLDIGGPAQGWRMYKEGWQNWSPAVVLPCSGEDLYMGPPVIGPTTQPPSQAGRFVSEMMTAIADKAPGLGLVAGFISTAEQFSQVWLDRETRALTAASYADGTEVPGGGTLSSERLLVQLAPEPLAAMQQYGEALAREMRATPWPHAVTGWCSWYYYWQGVSEESILANMEYLRWHRGELPVEYVQIDDGYQAGIGDWLTPNEKFPRGMKWIADQIHDRGYKAGLWLAPFMMGANSRLWREHPDWAVQYEPGKPYVAMVNWNQECYALDLTHPDATAWLKEVFRTVFDEWGYDYIKIDFLYAGAVDGIRHDPNVTRAQAYRRGIELILAAAGERFILGCGNPVAPSIGVVNGMRIGPDVAPFWYPVSMEQARDPERNNMSLVSTLNGIRNIIGRFWMHNRLWLNDPDCMLARDSETALTPGEVRTLASVIALSGGMAFDSDNLMRLTEDRRALVSMLLPPYGRSCVPLDLFESDLARLLDLDCGTHRLLGVFNWADEAAEVRVPLPPEALHVFDVWEREYLGVRQGALSFTLPAHGCKLLGLRPAADRPQLVGSTFHLLQGAMETSGEEWDGKTLRLSLRPVAVQRGEMFVHVPPRWSTPAIEYGSEVEISHPANEVLALRFELGAAGELRLNFRAR